MCSAQNVLNPAAIEGNRECWHFCTTSNVNKLATVNSLISFKVNLHLPNYFELQECIPVGCVPSAGGGASAGGCLPRGMFVWGCLLGGCLPMGCIPTGSAWGMSAQRGVSGVCPGGCLHGVPVQRGVSAWGVSAQRGGVCPRGV